jgi:hypothetical protein
VAAFSADGTRIVTGADQAARVFDAESGEEIGDLKGHEGEVRHASFSPDGTRIVTGSSDSSVRILDAESFSEIAVLKGHNYGIDYVAFSPDGQRILSAGGAQGIVWTRLPPMSLPEGLVGFWFTDFSNPGETLPPEVVRAMCVTNPIRISDDGLILFFEGTDVEPPQTTAHMRCASDLTCEIFAGGSTQGAELIGEGNVTFSESRGDLCMTGVCRPIARCPALNWTDEERSRGFADRWEASVEATGN